MARRLIATLLSASLLAACSDASAPPAPSRPPAKASAEAEAPRPPEQTAISPTLRKVRERGRLNCGVNGERAGFSARDDRGAWRGFDVDFCRALAAAVLGDARSVTFTALDTRTRFPALQSGAVDVLARNTAWTFSRDAALGVEFAGTSYYDTQALMTLRSLNLQNAADIANRRVCVTAGAEQQSLADFFRAHGVAYTPVPAETPAAARLAFERNECEVLSDSLSDLAASRAALARPEAYVVLPETVAKEPLGPVVREGDDAWQGIVRWTLYSLILAEEHGVTAQGAAAARRNATDPEVRRLLGAEGGFGQLLGLRDDWAYRAISQVGNYGEIFNRNLGAATPLALERGPNALWNAQAPGLLYSPPMR